MIFSQIFLLDFFKAMTILRDTFVIFLTPGELLSVEKDPLYFKYS